MKMFLASLPGCTPVDIFFCRGTHQWNFLTPRGKEDRVCDMYHIVLFEDGTDDYINENEIDMIEVCIFK